MRERLYAGYELLGRIATGGMGEVYVARRFGGMGFEKVVALKRLLPKLSSDAAYVRMFGDEARTLARLTHPSIVQVLDCGFAEGLLYVALEYVHGENLGRLLERYIEDAAGMPAAMVAHLGATVARALHHAHEARDEHGRLLGLYHGDVSPHNVLLSYDGNVKLADFGVARHAGGEAAANGNPCYMAPEVIGGHAADRRADLFGLGVMLWEMTAGRRLFVARSFARLRQMVLSGRVPRLRAHARHVPRALEGLVQAMLSPDPAARPATALDVARHLDEVARAQPPFDEGALGDIMATRFAVERAYRDRMMELARRPTIQDYLETGRHDLSGSYESLQSSKPVVDSTAPITIRGAALRGQ